MPNNLVSVIVPVYKVEKYLDECVTSIRNQTYRNLEVILIDDGSPDRCGDMCDNYAVQDNRIKVIHKKNGGLSSARNAGLDICNGDFIVCIDSDDLIAENYIEHLLKLCLETEADVSVCQVNDFKDGDKCLFTELTFKEEYRLLPTMEAASAILYMRGIRTGVIGKLISAKLYNGIRFEEGQYYEDVIPMFRIITKANKVAVSNAVLFGYRHRSSAQSRQPFSLKEMDSIDVADELDSFVSERFPKLFTAMCSKTISMNFHIFGMIPYNGFEKEKDRIWENIKKYRKHVLKDRNGRKKARFGALLSYSGKRITHFLMISFKPS